MPSDKCTSGISHLHREDAQRALAGLAVGTNWKDHTGKHRIISYAENAEENGIGYVRLQFKTGGSISHETFWTYVKTVEWEQHGPDADRCVEFVNRYVDTGTEHAGGDGQ